MQYNATHQTISGIQQHSTAHVHNTYSGGGSVTLRTSRWTFAAVLPLGNDIHCLSQPIVSAYSLPISHPSLRGLRVSLRTSGVTGMLKCHTYYPVRQFCVACDFSSSSTQTENGFKSTQDAPLSLGPTNEKHPPMGPKSIETLTQAGWTLPGALTAQRALSPPKRPENGLWTRKQSERTPFPPVHWRKRLPHRWSKHRDLDAECLVDARPRMLEWALPPAKIWEMSPHPKHSSFDGISLGPEWKSLVFMLTIDGDGVRGKGNLHVSTNVNVRAKITIWVIVDYELR
jgi:hypothetical protein